MVVWAGYLSCLIYCIRLRPSDVRVMSDYKSFVSSDFSRSTHTNPGFRLVAGGAICMMILILSAASLPLGVLGVAIIAGLWWLGRMFITRFRLDLGTNDLVVWNGFRSTSVRYIEITKIVVGRHLIVETLSGHHITAYAIAASREDTMIHQGESFPERVADAIVSAAQEASIHSIHVTGRSRS